MNKIRIEQTTKTRKVGNNSFVIDTKVKINGKTVGTGKETIKFK